MIAESHIDRRRHPSPRMPVHCVDCRFCVQASVYVLIHCVSGPVSEIRLRNFSSLCPDFAPVARPAGATSASEAAAGCAQQAEKLYVPVTRKVTATAVSKVSLTPETKAA